MNYFEELAQSFGQQLIKPRKYNYSEQLLEHFFIENPHLKYRFTKIPNKRHQLLETILVKNTIEKSTQKKCIIYAHGLGSNKLQVLSILKHYKHFQYDICSFDFSGSGKSQGKYTSYGLRQQDDVSTILAWLDQNHCYDQYILWGRSMGSVAIILSQGLILNSKVKNIVLDSPFSSFQKVSLQIASKKSFIPQLFLQPLLDYLKYYFQSKNQFNPFAINVIEKIMRIDIKLIFVYSKNDTIVNCSHSNKLKLNCRYIPHQIQINEDHNMQRSRQTHIKIHNLINAGSGNFNKNYQNLGNQVMDLSVKFECYTNRARSQSRNRGISLTSKQNLKQNYQNQSNRIRKSTGGNQAKINLVTTHSLTLNRKDSMRNSQKSKKLKSVSSVQIADRNSQNKFNQSKNRIEILGGPSSLISLNSIQTVQSNNEQSYREQTETKINIMRKNQSILDITHKLAQVNNNPNYEKHSKISYLNQPKQRQKISSFYSASFMDENLNILCSINSICLNRKKLNDKQGVNTKEKPHVATSVKRPSIQLRRKNRFVV